MRIGIDESGDFTRHSAMQDHFSVAIEARSGSLERFRRWESSVGKEQRSGGEVKGSLLTTEQLACFVNDVLAPEPPIRLRPVLLRPTAESPESVNSSRHATADQLEAEAQAARAAGDLRAAGEAQQCARWIRALNDSDYLWLNAMSTCVGAAIYDVFLDSDAGGYSEELRHLKIVVDQRKIRANNVPGKTAAVQAVAWFLQVDSAQAFPAMAPLLRRMADAHPLAEQWRTLDRKWRVVPLIEAICDFSARSIDHPAIRIADVVATIYGRASRREDSAVRQVRHRCEALVGGSGMSLWVRLARTGR